MLTPLIIDTDSLGMGLYEGIPLYDSFCPAIDELHAYNPTQRIPNVIRIKVFDFNIISSFLYVINRLLIGL
jgi:hypothetical protein